MNRFAIALEDDKRGHDVDPQAACSANPSPARFVWVHLDGREQDTLGWLKEHGGMPETVAYALVAIETRPRFDAIENGALVNLRGPLAEGEPTEDRFVSIRLWIERGRAISVGFRPIAGLDELHDRMVDGAIKDPGDLISQLAVAITRQVDPVITTLGDLVDDCETALDPDRAFETRRLIAGARSDAIVYRRFVAPQREALARMAAFDAPWIEDDDRLHLREAADRFARMAEELESVRERSALIHEQLTDVRSEQIEKRALLISIVALIFLPLTFITGLLGVNVDGIPFAHVPWAFAAVCASCLAIALAVVAWFARAHWFGK